MKERFSYPKRAVCVTCDQDVSPAPTQHADVLYVDRLHKGCKKPPHWTDALNLGRQKVTLGPVKTEVLKP